MGPPGVLRSVGDPVDWEVFLAGTLEKRPEMRIRHADHAEDSVAGKLLEGLSGEPLHQLAQDHEPDIRVDKPLPGAEARSRPAIRFQASLGPWA